MASDVRGIHFLKKKNLAIELHISDILPPEYDDGLGRPLQHRQEEVPHLRRQVQLVPVRHQGREDDDGGDH